ncbi:hypothetical protein D6C87_09808 [Aureobasidium pullulans]|uniref:Uncharacterized protein n=1 Tax=Aureobasidium pullulans TaxID=5580 RepID=A0A4S9HJX6_AURPU|nr:hypothetical protein D6D04_07286 [Aureobasidium pullulans]THY71395.1 hypothetical protein D6C94_07730 [Aureobasidium pullulans]THZ35449.1 hypothetical protein D6C87_09808 [Aureobasidium pullulans]
MNSEILKAGESFIHRTSPKSSIQFLLPLFSPSLFCIHHHPSHSSRLRFFHQHLASAIKHLLILCRRTDVRSKTAEPKDRAATDQSDRRSRTQIRSRLTTLAISEDISVVACGSPLRLLLPVHPSTNTSPHAPRSAVVFPRTQHRVDTGQSDRILLLESIENIKICPQWTLLSSSPSFLDWASLPLEHQLVDIFNLCSPQIARAASLRTQSLTANLTVSPSCFYMIPTAHKTDKVPQMSQELHVEVKDFVKGLYDKLCKSHGVTPTVHEVQMIRRSIGALSKNKLSFVEPALLFFLPMSSLQYEMDSLLIGWIDQSDGSKKGIWFKLFENYPRVYNQCGGPTGSLHTPGRYVCDEWVPALDEVLYLDECQSRTVQYAYFATILVILRSKTPPPSIENRLSLVTENHKQLDGENRRLSSIGNLRETKSRRRRRLVRASEIAAIDLTGSHSEQDVEPRSELKPELTSSPPQPTITRESAHDFSTDEEEDEGEDDGEEDEAPIPPTNQDLPSQIAQQTEELREMVKAKPVKELRAILSQRTGSLPSWIEELVREELDQKTLRELKSAKNWLR